jgi:hypothetical protein
MKRVVPRQLALVLLLTACGDTGGDAFSIPLIAGGATDARSFEDDGFTITLDDARIGYGPVYFCATSTADLGLCPAALAEFRGAATVDVSTAEVEMVGSIEARSGTIRSGMWDYARPFLLGADAPTPITGAVDGERSARFSGTASRGAESFRFVAELDISNVSASGLPAVSAVRTAHELVDGADALTVTFDAQAIVSRLDFEALASRVVDGEVRVVPGDVAYNALVQALTSSALPTLTWARPD